MYSSLKTKADGDGGNQAPQRLKRHGLRRGALRVEHPNNQHNEPPPQGARKDRHKMEKFSKWEIVTLHRLGVTASDVHKVGGNSYGTVWGLYNNYYLVEKTFNGYTKPEIYRILARDLLDKIGLFAE